MQAIKKIGLVHGKGSILPAIMGVLDPKIITPKGVSVFRRGAKKPSGRTTGKASRCRMDGCPGYRISVIWDNGERTRPCSKGMILTKKGWRII